MSAVIYIKSKQETTDVLPLVKSAIDAEIARLELASEMAAKRLLPFEKKYNVTSEYFIANLAAEDLEDGDDEYISWAGEYELKKRLDKKLEQLREIEYGHSDLLPSN
jgi:hypothetical protein